MVKMSPHCGQRACLPIASELIGDRRWHDGHVLVKV
jgi:hypothetical protein